MHDLSRRELLLAAGVGAAALAATAVTPLSLLAEDKKVEGFTLPKLPYANDALEPHIDAETMEIHHDKHHAAYVTNLNKALEGIRALSTKHRRPAAQHRDGARRHPHGRPQQRRRPRQPFAVLDDHGPKGGGGEPTGELAKAIDAGFGGFDKFKDEVDARRPRRASAAAGPGSSSTRAS